MQKSRDAFRTISEVSDWLDTPTHVLRFWESKFSQIKPVKRAGGRRYYRPEDMELLGGIKKLLHEDGMTIKGVQKLLKEQGVRHVSALGLTVVEPQDDPETMPAPEPEEVRMDDEVIEAGDTPPRKPTRKEKPDLAKRDEDAAIGDLFGAGPAANVVPIRPIDVAPAANSVPTVSTDPILALLLAADPVKLRRRKARLKPLYDRLVAVHHRLQQD